MSLAQKIVTQSVMLSISTLETCGGAYLITKTLTVIPEEREFVFRVRYNGSPWGSENEIIDSWEYPTAEAAAEAAIKKFGIINVTEWGDAVYRPEKKEISAVNCKRCTWYCASAKFCAIAPTYLGRPKECPEFEADCKKPAPPKVQLERVFQLAKSLKKAGIL